MALVIDAHFHVFGEGYLPKEWYRRVADRWAAAAWPPRDPAALDAEGGLVDEDAVMVLPEFDKAGINAGVAFALDWGLGGMGDAPVAMDAVHANYARLQQRYAGRFFGVAGVDPRRPNTVQVLKDAIVKHGLKGLKLYPPRGFFPHDPACEPMYQTCLELGVPVIFHTALVGAPHIGRFAHPLHVNDVQARHPDLTIIFAHAGYPFWAHEAMDVAASHPRSYLDISNWNLEAPKHPERVVRLLLEMRDAVGAHRILFATDHLGGRRFSGSRGTLALWVNFIRELPDRARKLGLDISEEEVALILGENARRVFNLTTVKA